MFSVVELVEVFEPSSSLSVMESCSCSLSPPVSLLCTVLSVEPLYTGDNAMEYNRMSCSPSSSVSFIVFGSVVVFGGILLLSPVVEVITLLGAVECKVGSSNVSLGISDVFLSVLFCFALSSVGGGGWRFSSVGDRLYCRVLRSVLVCRFRPTFIDSVFSGEVLFRFSPTLSSGGTGTPFC